jgi:CheY-like chemotaxis protein
MLHRIHEILLVASPYDAFILEEDGRLTQQILYEYLGMNLSYAPRVWHAKNASTGLQMLSNRSFDLVIVMMRIADMDPITFGEKVKKSYPGKPIILLAFDESEITNLPQDRLEKTIEKVFIWTGNANVFPAIIKYIEDRMNLHRDYKIADIRAIVLVEDNPRFYSIILPLIYRIALKHARDLINKSLSDTDKLLLFRARPKIILASSYEEAVQYYDKYRHNILGFISDVRFPKGGHLDLHAGVKLVEYIRQKDSDMPVVLQSTNLEHYKDAKKVTASFIHKESATLLQDMDDFIINNFGFGDFIFRNPRGKEIARANDLLGFRKSLTKIPDNSLEFHASKNHFSNWLAVRAEFSIASNIRPLKVHDFKSLDELRKLIIELIDAGIQAHHEGKIVQYSSTTKNESLNFVRLATGSLGGKARGLAFANNMLSDGKINKEFPDIYSRVPKIAVIGTDEFDFFMNENKLWKVAFSKNKPDKAISKAFLKASLSKELLNTLSRYLSKVKYPIAVRSSSLLEDSQYQPLAGMYSTFMLSNSDKSRTTRLEQLTKAIKLVYASTYFKEPKSLIEGSVHRHEEEKMAVIIMELIGQQHEDRFYPSASGSAQSFNYYPISYMKREEGVAFLALGLGRTIAEGEKSLRFSPKYPGIIPQYFSVRSTIANSQNQFYALNLEKGNKLMKYGEKENTSAYDLSFAEGDGELRWAGSVVSEEDNVIRDSLRHKGTRVITFPSLLKWKTAPIPELLTKVLTMGEDALGCPVEIEFAVNLYKDQNKKHEFCLLQIKPMVIGGLDRVQKFDSLNKNDIICSSSIALGNGVIDNLQNIVIVDPKVFDAAHTQTIAKDIEHINSKMPNGEKFILIGPGRWGSADPWLGIPVNWDQISNAKVIIEVGMDSFPVDPSFGSHFFQNVTSMRIGYFTINHKKEMDRLNMKWIDEQPVNSVTKYTKWIHLDRPVTVTIDGQTGEGAIIKPLDEAQEIMDEHEASGI